MPPGIHEMAALGNQVEMFKDQRQLGARGDGSTLPPSSERAGTHSMEEYQANRLSSAAFRKNQEHRFVTHDVPPSLEDAQALPTSTRSLLLAPAMVHGVPSDGAPALMGDVGGPHGASTQPSGSSIQQAHQ